MRLQPVFEQVNDAIARKSGGDEQVGSVAEGGDERARRFDLDRFAVALELPRHEGTADESEAQARVVEQLPWMPRAPMALEVGR